MTTKAKREAIESPNLVRLALSKARAARCLAAAVVGDSADVPRLPTRYEADAEDMYTWMRSFAFDALDAALDEVDAAYRKSLTPEKVRGQVIAEHHGGDVR